MLPTTDKVTNPLSSSVSFTKVLELVTAVDSSIGQITGEADFE
jgi:hypothetical protein